MLLHFAPQPFLVSRRGVTVASARADKREEARGIESFILMQSIKEMSNAFFGKM
jgi:hypothetical protein